MACRPAHNPFNTLSLQPGLLHAHLNKGLQTISIQPCKPAKHIFPGNKKVYLFLFQLALSNNDDDDDDDNDNNNDKIYQVQMSAMAQNSQRESKINKSKTPKKKNPIKKEK